MYTHVQCRTLKQTRCTNFLNLFLEWKSTYFGQFLCPSSGVFHCTHSNGMCYTVLQTACEQDQDGSAFHPDPVHRLSAKLYDIYHCRVYSVKLLIIDKELSETCRVLFSELIYEISASNLFCCTNLSWCAFTWTSDVSTFLCSLQFVLYVHSLCVFSCLLSRSVISKVKDLETDKSLLV
jgi:hypothetical protein